MKPQAIQHILNDCDHPKHEGAGYTLDLHFETCVRPDMAVVRWYPAMELLVVRHVDPSESGRDLFVDASKLTGIMVNWD